jgi:Cu2+-containing amine oxidase
MVAYPFSALSEDEIILASHIIRACYAPSTKLRFKGISLHEPGKAETQRFRKDKVLPPQKAWVNYYREGTASSTLHPSDSETDQHIRRPAVKPSSIGLLGTLRDM